MSHSKAKKQAKLSYQEYHIDGMHCPSCELLMEKQFKKLPGVKTIDADAQLQVVKIGYVGAKAPSLAAINKLITQYNYCALPAGQALAKPKPKLSELLLPLLLAVVLLFGFLELEKYSANLSALSSTSAGLLKPFLFGVAASISSCAALIGGIILSLSKDWNAVGVRRKPFPVLQFNLGRLAAFILLGGLLGALGGIFSLSLEATAVFIILVSTFMIVLGAQMLNIFPVLNKFQIKTPKFLSRKVVDGSESSFAFSPLLVGIGTFFLPCAFTLLTQTDALSSGSFIDGAGIMGAFALGTLPVLVFIGLTAKQFTMNAKFSGLFLKTAGIVVILFALYTINNQMNVLGLTTFTDLI